MYGLCGACRGDGDDDDDENALPSIYRILLIWCSCMGRRKNIYGTATTTTIPPEAAAAVGTKETNNNNNTKTTRSKRVNKNEKNVKRYRGLKRKKKKKLNATQQHSPRSRVQVDETVSSRLCLCTLFLFLILLNFHLKCNLISIAHTYKHAATTHWSFGPIPTKYLSLCCSSLVFRHQLFCVWERAAVRTE